MRITAPLFLLLVLVLAMHDNFSFALDETGKPKVIDNSISARLDAIEKNLSMLQKYVYNSSVIGSDKGSSSSTKAIDSLNADEVTDQFKSIRSEIEKLQYNDARLKEKSTQIAADLEYRITQIEKMKGTRDTVIDNALGTVDDYLEDKQAGESVNIANNNTDIANGNPAGTGSANSKISKLKTPEEQYQDAYTLLRAIPMGGSYMKAIKGFEKFISQNPKHVLVGNAYYWMAEAYTNNGDYDTAAMQYLNGYKANPSSGRASDNLLGLSKSLLKLNKRQEACSTLVKLKTTFPNASNTVKRNAEQIMKQSGCS